jgi:hypothetical protein
MSGYTLIGFSGGLYNTTPGRMFNTIPIYLPNQEIPGSFESRLPNGYSASIIIPELYKVRWVRGLDMFNIFYKDGYIILYDENEKDIFLHNPPLPINSPAFTAWLSRPYPNGKTPIQIMQEIEDKYPGLFIIPEYVKPHRGSPSKQKNLQIDRFEQKPPTNGKEPKKLSRGGMNKTKKPRYNI